MSLLGFSVFVSVAVKIVTKEKKEPKDDTSKDVYSL